MCYKDGSLSRDGDGGGGGVVQIGNDGHVGKTSFDQML